MVQLQDIGNLLGVAKRGATLNQVADALFGATDSLRDLIDVLGLDDCLEVVFEELGEVV